jgi:hypothetical protein
MNKCALSKKLRRLQNAKVGVEPVDFRLLQQVRPLNRTYS